MKKKIGIMAIIICLTSTVSTPTYAQAATTNVSSLGAVVKVFKVLYKISKLGKGSLAKRAGGAALTTTEFMSGSKAPKPKPKPK